MNTKILFSCLLSILWIPHSLQASTLPEIPEGCSDAPVTIANHSARFRGVIYDYPAAGQST